MEFRILKGGKKSESRITTLDIEKKDCTFFFGRMWCAKVNIEKVTDDWAQGVAVHPQRSEYFS